MRFSLAPLLSAFISLTTASTSFTANSKAGKKLLSVAKNIKSPSHDIRRLEDGFDESFVAQYSIIYEGCHNDTSWEDENYRSVGLVRFKLCPSEYCSSWGCSSEYAGEYLVELQTFLDSYLESKMEAIEYKCEMMRELCGCDDDDNGNCAYYCYQNYGYDYSDSDCDEDEDEDEEQLGGECKEFDWEINDDDNDDNDDQQRRLEDEEAEEEEEGVFIGPYCAANGKHIRFSLFTDEYCSVEYPGGGSSHYRNITGQKIPYHQASAVDRECLPCKENGNEDEQNENDQEDEDNVSEFCEETYEMSAKCEEDMINLDGFYPDTSACDVISKLKSINPGYVYQDPSSYDDDGDGVSNSGSFKFDFKSMPKISDASDEVKMFSAGVLGLCVVAYVIFAITRPSKSQPQPLGIATQPSYHRDAVTSMRSSAPDDCVSRQYSPPNSPGSLHYSK